MTKTKKPAASNRIVPGAIEVAATVAPFATTTGETAVADRTAATATPSTGAPSEDGAPGAAMLLTVPAAPSSRETESLVAPQLGAAAGDFSQGGFTGAAATQNAASDDDGVERRWFPAASPILRDGVDHGIGEPIKVTEAEHKVLHASLSITGEWDD